MNRSVERGLCFKRIVLSYCKEEKEDRDKRGSMVDEFNSIVSFSFSSCTLVFEFLSLNRVAFSSVGLLLLSLDSNKDDDDEGG